MIDLSNYVQMPDTDYKAICDATREKCGTTGLLKSGEIKPLLEALETDGAKFYLTVNVDSGSTVTATKGGLSVSGTAANGKAVLELPEAGEWTVTATLNGQSASGVVQVVGDFAAEAGFTPAVFADATWAQIIAACQSGSVPDTWAVGDQKAMTINGADYLIDIIGKNHDRYADGSGYAPLTLQMHDCYGTKYGMNSTGTNAGGWTDSVMRKTHLPAILALMPSEVRVGIKEVNKLTSAGSRSSIINTTADKLFLLSEIEVFGSVKYSVSGEGEQYAYYSTGNSPIKSFNGAETGWWERSPRADDSTIFCRVYGSGIPASTGATLADGIAFAFCF